jgi:cellulose synthase/poly-beta-1,6-N-acetylglucosamine synthase-like glycosyltransferase
LPGIGLYSFYLIITYWHSSAGRFLLNLIPLMISLFVNAAGTIFLFLREDYSLEKGIWLLSVSWIACSFSASVLLFQSLQQGKTNV